MLKDPSYANFIILLFLAYTICILTADTLLSNNPPPTSKSFFCCYVRLFTGSHAIYQQLYYERERQILSSPSWMGSREAQCFRSS